MHKSTVIVLGMIFLVMCGLVAALLLISPTPVVVAQTDRSVDEIRKREWDKSVSDEKLKRVRDESAAIQASVVDLVRKKFPRYHQIYGRLYEPKSQAIGRRGQTGFSISWQKGSTRFSLELAFVFSRDEAVSIREKTVNGISMGDFYPAPTIFGKDAIVVKNVELNKMATQVSLHFSKGRLIVSSYVLDQSRSNSKNEKELLEIMEAIYPLLVAKENFEDV